MQNNRLIIISGTVIGILGAVLVFLGNPLNMGICVACFVRDIAGGLGLHQAEVVQYIRPEIIGFLLGAFLISSFFREFKPTGGSSPIIRFFLGILMMFGALVFLGCPLRMVLRLAGGDMNAFIGFLGFATGIWIGIIFLKQGFSLGKSSSQSPLNGYFTTALATILFILFLIVPVLFISSVSGPGAERAPIIISLLAGLLVGILSQRSRICMAGAVRDIFLLRNPHLLYGFISIFVFALLLNIFGGNFQLGFVDQPVAHTQWFWNFSGMALVGLTAVLLGGCPLRQFILAGQGNSDSGITIMGMIAGGAIAHNFGLAASPAGVPFAGQIAVILGLLFSLIIGSVVIKNKV